MLSDVLLARIDPKFGYLDLIGTIPAVKSAKLMLTTQLEYIDKQIEIDTAEKTARNQLMSAKRYNKSVFCRHYSVI